jgi:hypothetical protein
MQDEIKKKFLLHDYLSLSLRGPNKQQQQQKKIKNK